MCKNSKTYKKQYFNDLNSKIHMDTKKFWAKVTPLFSSKSTTANIIVPNENNRITKGKKNISHTLNKDFTHLTKTFRLKKTSLTLKNKPVKHVLKNFKREETLNGKEKELTIYSYFFFLMNSIYLRNDS